MFEIVGVEQVLDAKIEPDTVAYQPVARDVGKDIASARHLSVGGRNMVLPGDELAFDRDRPAAFLPAHCQTAVGWCHAVEIVGNICPLSSDIAGDTVDTQRTRNLRAERDIGAPNACIGVGKAQRGGDRHCRLIRFRPGY